MRSLSRIALLALTLIVAPASQANDPEDLTYVAPEDISHTYMREIFGSVAGYAVGEDGPEEIDSLLGATSEILNIGMMTFVFLIVGWIAVTGLFNTASEGETLGKNYSTVWTPVRVIGSLALVFPVAGGYSTMQVIILYFATQGIGIANSTWEAAKEYIEGEQTIYAIETNQYRRTLATQMLLSHACTIGINTASGGRVIEEKPLSPTPVMRAAFSWIPGVDDGQPSDDIEYHVIGKDPAGNDMYSTVGMSYDGVDDDVYPRRACGSWYVPFPPQPEPGKGDNAEAALARAANAYYRNITVALQGLNDAMRALASQAIDVTTGNRPNDAGMPQRFNEAVAAYHAGVEGAEEELRSDLRAIDKDEAVREKTGAAMKGWIGAGMYYTNFQAMTTRYLSITEFEPAYAPVREEATQHPDFETVYRAGLELVAKANNTAGQANTGAAGSPGASVPAEDGGVDVVRRGLSFIVTSLQTTTTAPDPIGALSAWSRATIDVGFWVYLGLKAVIGDSGQSGGGGSGALTALATGGPVAAFLAAAGSAAWAAIKALLGYVMLLGLFLLPFLVILAYYIPFLPFILWSIGVAGWFIMLIESIIAGPIWAVTHALPEGVGPVAERAKAGYLILLSVFLRPTLMIMGLLASIFVMQLTAKFVLLAFVPVATTSVGLDGGGLVRLVALIAIMVLLLLQLANRVYSLIHEIPDKVLRYIGSAHEVLGEAETERGMRGIFIAGAQHSGRDAITGGGARPPAPPSGARPPATPPATRPRGGNTDQQLSET